MSAVSGHLSSLHNELAERIQSVLASKGISLYQASRQSESRYGRSSPYFLPHNLYYDLRSRSFSPSMAQLFALSQITGYRLPDWLHVFGLDVDVIPRLQVLLPSDRTIVLNSSLADPNAWIPWVQDRAVNASVQAIAPLGQMLVRASPQRLGSISASTIRGFLYAKIGREDAFAFPDLLPGSIVRVNQRFSDDLISRGQRTVSRRIFLVEHGNGVCCARLRAMGHGAIMLASTLLPYAQVELKYPSEARILGVVDLELRPLIAAESPVVKELARQWKPRPLVSETSIGPMLRQARLKVNLSFRRAAEISHTIGNILGDDRYSISASSLCGYEAISISPRSVHKAITLCSLYGLHFESFLLGMGINVEEAGREAMPDPFVNRLPPPTGRTRGARIPAAGEGFLAHLLKRSGEVPIFLRDCVNGFSGSAKTSLDDFFWIGGENYPLHPYLENGLVALVNRRRKSAVHFTEKPLWQQPIYILLLRDGTYLAACCGIENGALVVHPYTEHFNRQTQLRRRRDAEVIGQIIAIARRLE